MELQRRLDLLAEGLEGRLGAAIYVAHTGERFGVHADELFPMASVFKVPLLVRLFELVDAGRASLEDAVVLREEDRAPGSGVLKELTPGARMTVGDLAMLMTIVSDNTATDVLFQRVGGSGGIALTLHRLGLARTAVRWDCRTLLNLAVGLPPADHRPQTLEETWRRLRAAALDYDGPAFASVLEGNCTTPRDMVALLAALHNGTAASAGACARMLDMLSRQQLRERIPRLFPRTVRIAHKTGTLGTTRNDVGIVYLPGGEPIVMALLSKDVPPDRWEEGDRCIAAAARAAYDAYA